MRAAVAGVLGILGDLESTLLWPGRDGVLSCSFSSASWSRIVLEG